MFILETELKKRKTKALMRAGELCGDFLLIRKRRGPRNCSPGTKMRWLVRCTAPDCNKELVIPQMYLRRKGNPKVNCGCRLKILKTTQNREYRIWLMMRVRTTDPSHIAYKHYGGRGIKVCDEWFPLEGGFEKFFAHIGAAPSYNYSIDRIDNNKGYQPGNVKWATAKEQRANQRSPEQIKADLAAYELKLKEEQNAENAENDC